MQLINDIIVMPKAHAAKSLKLIHSKLVFTKIAKFNGKSRLRYAIYTSPCTFTCIMRTMDVALGTK